MWNSYQLKEFVTIPGEFGFLNVKNWRLSDFML